MDDLNAIDIIRGKLAERKITNESMRPKVGISNAYISMMLNGKCAMSLDFYLFLCKESGIDPLQLRKEFKDDFGKNGSIPAIGYRPKDR